MAEPTTVVIMAAQRDGRLDPLAAEAGVTHKCLVPLLGLPLLSYVMETIVATPGVKDLRISVEPDAAEALRPLTEPATKAGIAVEFVASAPNIAESVYSAVAGVEGPILITTGDNVLMTPGALNQAAAALERADAVVALATKTSVVAAHPQGQNRFYRFSDESYSNCNLYGLAGPGAVRAAEIFRGGGQFAKNRQRMRSAFGTFNILMMGTGLISMPFAMRRLSKRLGVRLAPVVLADGAHAIDVDNRRTYDIAELILGRRGGRAW